MIFDESDEILKLIFIKYRGEVSKKRNGARKS